MACRGCHYALTDEQATRLLNANVDQEVIRVIQEGISTTWDGEWSQGTDKAWDAIHRCLTDGTLRCKGQSILEKCVLGGRHIHRRNNYIVSFVRKAEGKDVTRARAGITQAWFRQKYFGLKKKFLWFEYSDYEGEIGEEDFEYSWDYFELLRDSFIRASAATRSVVFVVDQ